MKRLLGNGFYLNVKFNQMTAKEHKNTPGERLKKYEKVEDQEYFDIKEGEVLYSCESKHNKKSTHSHVLSSLNGSLNSGEDEESLYDTCRFEGIAQTEHKMVDRPQIDQGLVSCVSGVITIINESKHTINPGDLLYLSVPCDKKPHRGIHPHKKRFCLAKYSEKEIAQMYLDMLDNANLTGLSDDQAVQKMKEIFNYSHIDKRQVAKAVSRAKYGEKLDILLYPRLSN